MKLVVIEQELKLSEFSTEYIDKYAKPRKKSWRKDVGYLRRNILPVLGELALEQVTSEHVANLHADIGMRAPYEANRTVEIIQVMFDCARDWGRVPRSFENPARAIQKFKEQNRTRWLTDREIEQLAPILKCLKPHQCIYFWMLILTGSRSSEMKYLRWENVDFQNSSIYIGETKNGDPQWLPVPIEAVAMLNYLPRNGELVFPACRYDKKWREIRQLIPSLRDVRLHDLRHTTASHLLQLGNHMRVVGEILNHRSLEATNRYAHLARQHLRAPLKELAAKMPLPFSVMAPVEAIVEIVDDEVQATDFVLLLEDKTVQNFKVGTERVPGTPGLRIRHNKSFSVYYADYYRDKVHRHETIGRLDQVSEQEAREACDKIISEKADRSKPKPQKSFDRPSYQWDSELPCFGIRRNKTSSSSWVVKYRDRTKKQVFLTLGRLDSMSEDEARIAARTVLESESSRAVAAAKKAAWNATYRSRHGWPRVVWDAWEPGLGQVFYKSKTSWIVRLRSGSKEKRITIGTTEEMSLGMAREAAKRIKREEATKNGGISHAHTV